MRPLLGRYVRPYRSLVAVVVTLQIVSTLASLYLPTVNAAIIDDGVAQGDTRTIMRLGMLMIGVTLVQIACSVGAVYFGSRTGMGFGRDMRSALFHHITGFSAEESSRFGAPTLLTRTTNDVQQLQVLVQITCTMLLTAPIMCIGGIAMAIHQNAGLSWLLMVSMPALGLVNWYIVRSMLPIFRKMQQLIDGINRVMREQLAGIRVIRAFTRETLERTRFGAANTEVSEAALAAGRWQALMLPTTSLVINTSSVALIWFGGQRIDQGQMQVGSLVAFLSYFLQILMSMMMLTMLAIMVPRASACAERITEVFETVGSITAPSNPVGVEALVPTVEFSDTGFRYPGAERAVLEGVSFTARPGTVTAVVGATGCGKSTLVSLVPRLHDVTAGSVRVSGHDVRHYDPESLWTVMGLVPQRGYLFSGTVESNLRYGKSDATEDEMWEALRIAQAADFVQAHASGLQMPVSQGGINFSGGQRQRIAIARAVIRRPSIYLFDDAFSALDVRTDARLREALRAISTDATVIVVAQRVSTIVDADQIVVLEDGRVAAVGTHAQLLGCCGMYREICDSQAVSPPMGRPREEDPAP
ncbi:MAG: ABC transporter ATP-binding protein [Mycobacterium sp.]